MPPFRLEAVAWALRRRPDNAVDRWDGEAYARTLDCLGVPVEARVRQIGPPERPAIRVSLSAPRLGARIERAAAAAIDRMLGLSVDLRPFYALASKDPRLGPLAARFRGLKPPRFPSVFEALINGVACQQFTLTSGIRLLNRLAETTAGAPDPPSFPSPERIARRSIASLRSLGLSTQKATAMTSVARAVVARRLDLEALAGLDDDAALERLEALRGVGRWTAEYVLLRGLGRIGTFPGDDVGARNNLARWLRLRKPLDYDGARRVLARWRPYAGLVYFHLLLERLADDGHLG